MQRGVDLHAARDSNHALELLQDAEKLLPEEKSLYGWGWSAARWGAVPDARLLDDAFRRDRLSPLTMTKAIAG